MTDKDILGKYRHFKGKEYEVIGIAKSSENLEEFVVYKSLYEDEKFPKGTLFIRPKNMFFETLEKNGKIIKRFEKI